MTDDETSTIDERRPGLEHGGMLAEGALIGRYRIEAVLGEGGMGVVYRAIDTELDRAVALKLVRPRQGDAAFYAERLKRESRLQARAAHRSVITVYDIGEADDQVYVAMELVRGGTLRDWLESKPRPWRAVLDVFTRAAEGLAAAHAAELVHRDFKPDNVLVERDGDVIVRVLVSDFGLARATGATDTPGRAAPPADLAMTATGAVIGTPAYMSPEQLEAKSVDARSDVFSFAVACWEALYGERPFRGETLRKMREAMTEPPFPPRGAGVPRWIGRALRRALAIDRGQRTPSMIQLVHELDWRRRRRRAIAALASGIAAAGIASGLAIAAAGHGEASTCALPSRLGDDITRAGEAITKLLPPDYGEYWKTSAARYARGWGRARALACTAWSEDQVRCVDRLGAEYLAILDGAAASDPVRRGDILRANAGAGPPQQCLSAAASALTAEVSLDRRAIAAQLALDAAVGADLRDATAAKVRSATARAMVAAAGFEPLQRAADGEAAWRDDPVVQQRLAQAADLAGDRRQAVSLWMAAAHASQDARVLAYADNALLRAGDPPRNRADWLLLDAGTKAGSAPANANASLARALATRAAAELPYDFQFAEDLVVVYMRLARNDDALRELHEVVRFAEMAGIGGAALLPLRERLARALAWSGRVSQAQAEIGRMLDGVEPHGALAPQLVDVIALDARIASWSDPADALRRLDHWQPALDATLGRDDAARAELAYVRASSLVGLGKYAEAERSARRAVEIEIASHGATSATTAQARILLGQILLELGRNTDGEDYLRRGTADLAAASGENVSTLAQGRFVLAQRLVGTHREGEALPLLEQALAAYEKMPQEFSAPDRAAVRWYLVRAIAAARPDSTRERALLEQALAEWGPHPEGYEHERAAALAMLHRLVSAR